MRGRFAIVYVSWIAVCLSVMAALRGAPDPSRRTDRIAINQAQIHAEEILAARGLHGYEAVHTAYASRGEGGKEARWVVLLDREPHSALRDARVVELRARDGALLTIRAPR